MNYNNTPLPRIVNARDPITGLKLVTFHKNRNRYKPNRHIPACRSGEEHLVENYDLAKNDNFRGWDLHHRLELTLEGEFANSAIDLVNKDMYFYRPYFELIWLRHGEHARLHRTADKGPSYGRTADKNPMYGRTKDKHPCWKGDDATEQSKRRRAYMEERYAKKIALRNLQSDFQANTH